METSRGKKMETSSSANTESISNMKRVPFVRLHSKSVVQCSSWRPCGKNINRMVIATYCKQKSKRCHVNRMCLGPVSKKTCGPDPGYKSVWVRSQSNQPDQDPLASCWVCLTVRIILEKSWLWLSGAACSGHFVRTIGCMIVKTQIVPCSLQAGSSTRV